MCGIIGYTGYRNASTVLMDCLKRLEYRGYDSTGIGLINKKITLHKEIGPLDKLEKKMGEHDTTHSHCGIGHTRWATHGKVTRENAHPHLSCHKDICLIHNGIIENYRELKKKLEKKHTFYSETDSEIAAHLIEENYTDNLEKAVQSAVLHLMGSFALVISSILEPGKIIAVRKESPLVIGMGDNENFIASDIPAFLPYTNRIKYLHDGEICILTKDAIEIKTLTGKPVTRETDIIHWSLEDAEKSGYPHFMLKEIHEQPQSLQKVIRDRISEIDPWVNLNNIDTHDIDTLTIIACGTSYYAGLAGKYIIEKLNKLLRIVKPSKFKSVHVYIPRTENYYNVPKEVYSWIEKSKKIGVEIHTYFPEKLKRKYNL